MIGGKSASRSDASQSGAQESAMSTPSVAAQPITDYAALLEFLQMLPPPAPGKLRVYRGQTKNYPQMLASGSRPVKPPNTSLFDFTTRIVAQDILKGPIDSDLELNMLMFWIQAVA